MKFTIEQLKEKSLFSRNRILEMGTNGGCFVGSAFSCIDIITYLYNEIIVNERYMTDDRDYFFLSKGHAVPAVYATLVELGFLERERLEKYNHVEDYLYLHPNKNIVGVEFHSGSLGHGLAIAMGVALDIKKQNGKGRVFVLLGDGELDEGSNWEALLNANSLKLDNLVIIIDRNQLQANFETEKLLPLESLKEKFEAFGMLMSVVDGHDFDKLDKTFNNLSFLEGKPNVIIANTIRGKGIKSIENDWEYWFMEYDNIKCQELKKELNGV